MSLLRLMKSPRPPCQTTILVHLFSFVLSSLIAGGLVGILASLPRWLHEQQPLFVAMHGSPVIPLSGLLVGFAAIFLRYRDSKSARPMHLFLSIYSLSALGWSTLEPFRDGLWSLTRTILSPTSHGLLAWTLIIFKPVLLPATLVAAWLCYHRVPFRRVVGTIAISCLLSALLFSLTSTHFWTVFMRGYESQWIVPFGSLIVPPPFVGAGLTLLATEIVAPGRFRDGRILDRPASHTTDE